MRPSGVALIAVLSIMLIVAAIIFGVSYTTQITSWLTRNDSTSTQASYIAQAGLQKYKTVLLQGYRAAFANGSATSTNGCNSIPASALDLDRSTAGVQNPITENITLGPTTGSVTVTVTQDSVNPNYVVLSSTGNFAGARSKMRAVFNLSNVGLAAYAVVSGAGNTGKINGNATIYGGIYVEGSQSNSSNPRANAVLSLTGSMSVQDSYSLSSGNALYTTIIPTAASNLCAAVRVRYGAVILGGSASFGTSSNPLVDIKAGDPIWVPAAQGGLIYSSTNGSSNNTINPQDCTNNLCAPSVGRYDLSSAVSPKFPNLTDNVTCGLVNSWRDCIIADAKNIQLWKGSTINTSPTQGITLPTTSTTALPTGMSWSNASSCQTLMNQASATITLAATGGFDCTFGIGGNPAGGFKYNTSTTPPKLSVYGTTTLKGFNITTSTNIDYVAYQYNYDPDPVSGRNDRRASLFLQANGSSGGKLELRGNLLPDSTARFPRQTLALLAECNSSCTSTDDGINLNSSGISVAAILYTPRRVHLSSNNQIAGTVITDTICVGNNCSGGGGASIYYVDPSGNLPDTLSMLPNEVVPTMRILSYERY